jgi:hypothetical protein
MSLPKENKYFDKAEEGSYPANNVVLHNGIY